MCISLTTTSDGISARCRTSALAVVCADAGETNMIESAVTPRKMPTQTLATDRLSISGLIFLIGFFSAGYRLAKPNLGPRISKFAKRQKAAFNSGIAIAIGNKY
jgi:hypothetical protein